MPGYDCKIGKEDLESCIREQNQLIKEDDELKITFLKKTKDSYTIFGECSPSLFHRLMTVGKIFIGWQRYSLYEDIGINRCFNCQEPFHKSENCQNQPICERCAGQHSTRECDNTSRMQCKNCVAANQKYKLKHKTDHRANDPDCPSYQYLLTVLRGKIDYGT